MADRKARFEKKFRNVWASGSTGVSYLQMTTHEDPGDFVNKLFKDTMIADEWNAVSSVKRTYIKNSHMVSDESIHHITMVTSDDRVAEVIEEAAAWTKQETKSNGVPFDLMVTPLSTGSKDYIEWVKTQTLKKDDGASFFNEKSTTDIKPLTDTVDSQLSDKSDVQTNVEETKGKSLWSSDPEDEEDDE